MLHHRIANKLGITEKKLNKIKNIIFDLGGVIIDIHFQETIKQFKKFGFIDFDSIYNQMKQTRLFDLFETGKIPPQAFRNELRKYKNQLTDEQIDYAWNLMIGEMPGGNIVLLKKIRNHYQTFLLSNTNAIHVDYFEHYLEQTFGFNPLPEMFEQTYYSFEIGERKPDTKIFEYVLTNGCLDAEETLLIDDTEANIQGAQKVGMLAYFLENEPISDLFE